MTRPRRIAVAVGAFLALLLLVMLVVPILYRDRIESRVKAEMSQALAARVDWRRAGLTFFRNFPNLTLRLDDVSVIGIDRFEDDTLAAVGQFRLVVGLGSVLRAVTGGGELAVRSITLDRPVAHLKVLEDGSRNWDIRREQDLPSGPETERPTREVSLRRVEIRQGLVTLDNRAAGLSLSLDGVRQSLAGNFGRDRFTLRARGRAEAVSLQFAGLTYLNQVRVDLRADVEADRVARRYAFGDNEVRLNDLPLRFSGSIGQEDDDLALDLEFAAPETDFRHLLSLIPAIYARDFASLETAGTMAVSGRVEGSYGDDAFPALTVRATVENGRFRYPDLPLPAREIALDLAIDNPGGDLDSTTIDLRRFTVVLGNEPVEGALKVRTPVSDPDIDLRLAGRLDLADLQRTVKLEGFDSLSGHVAANVTVRTRMSALDAGRYDRVTARGTAEGRNLVVARDSRPEKLLVEEARLTFAPQFAELTSFRGRIGSSDLDATGRIDNVLGYLFRNEPLRGRALVRSARLDLNEWRSDDELLEVIPVPDNLAFDLQVTVDHLRHDSLDLRNARGSVRVAEQRLTMEDFRGQALGGEIAISGFYETTDETRPTFDALVRLTGLDIPGAFSTFATVRRLAPVARHTEGKFTADLGIRGTLAPDMTPLVEQLTGRGSLETTRIRISGFPAIERIADVLRIARLQSPNLDPLRALIEIRDGRVHVRPFTVEVAGLTLTASGSHGLDQSLDYALRLKMPRGLIGPAAHEVLGGMLERAGRAGLDLHAADVLEIGIALTGTVSNPSVRPDVAILASSVEAALRGVAANQVERLEEHAAEVAESATAEARAEAERILKAAEERAAALRDEATKLAEKIRLEGYAQADSLVARASGPVALVAARLAADRLRKETDNRAEQIIREAGQRADEILADARKRASALRSPDR